MLVVFYQAIQHHISEENIFHDGTWSIGLLELVIEMLLESDRSCPIGQFDKVR
jgi:hypothetical protein